MYFPQKLTGDTKLKNLNVFSKHSIGRHHVLRFGDDGFSDLVTKCSKKVKINLKKKRNVSKAHRLPLCAESRAVP